jgi:hypothetical protein
MAILYDILKKKQLNKYPPLPQWVKTTIDALAENEESDRYFEFTNSIYFDEFEKKWTRSTED